MLGSSSTMSTVLTRSLRDPSTAPLRGEVYRTRVKRRSARCKDPVNAAPRIYFGDARTHLDWCSHRPIGAVADHARKGESHAGSSFAGSATAGCPGRCAGCAGADRAGPTRSGPGDPGPGRDREDGVARLVALPLHLAR